jgi:hypothetical protein
MPGLKGVTNFFVAILRIGVPLARIGVENIDPGVFTSVMNGSAGLGPLVGVKATVLQSGDVRCGFAEVLEAAGSRRGDLNGFIAAFPSVPKSDGV